MTELSTHAFDELWVQLEKQGMSRASLQGTKTTANKIFTHAKRKKIVSHNPVLESDLPEKEDPDRELEPDRWWSSDELGSWVRSTEEDRLHALWAVYASTGCRRGEALALRWTDLDGSRLRITKSLTATDDGPREGPPKTKSGSRELALDTRTLEALTRWRRAQAAEKLAYGPGYNDAGYLFTDPAGQPLDPRAVSRAFAATVRRTGLRPVRLHDVRHAWASAAIEKGMSVKGVSERLGHSRIEVTLNLYVHTGPEADQGIADQMGEVIWGSG
jgi:integrase